ncbi:hypothetical protein [Bradyrhizobium sp.]|uniref:hypothetical protein n=1 Tax=Bradyrhizobium sp. TaxID=376 RepID=UPI002C25710A|nr:hypothetical protein [Bradyrhizobium sp.]HWX64391.1 hypothetical protein [Bradyrhizobium sp.]
MKLAMAPGRVRKYEIQHATFVCRRPFFEEPLRILGQRQQHHAFVHVGALGRLMPTDFPQASILGLAPFL